MGGRTTSSSSSASSSSQSSGARGHRQREERGMDKFEHLSLHHTSPPPPRFVHSRGKKHHCHRHQSHASPSSPSHHRHHFFEHPRMEGLHHHSRSFPTGCPQRHHHKEGKLRMKPPKHLKKIHKLHRKLLKAYKFPKSARHGAHHLLCPSPNMSFFDVPHGHNHPPGCCLHKTGANDGPSRCHEMGILHHDHPRCHGRHRHPACRRHSLNNPEAVGAEVAMVSPREVKASADPVVEGPPMALTSDMPPADQPEAIV